MNYLKGKQEKGYMVGRRANSFRNHKLKTFQEGSLLIIQSENLLRSPPVAASRKAVFLFLVAGRLNVTLKETYL